MSAATFLARQLGDLRHGGPGIVGRKVRSLGRRLLPLLRLLLALPAVVLIRALSPFLVIRFQPIVSDTIGHLAGNPEIYLCERELGIDLPKRPTWDICYFAHRRIANPVLASMWRRVLRIWPRWLAAPIHELNQRIPGGSVHAAGSVIRHHRDIHNALDKRPPHLSFTSAEEDLGRAGLRLLGLPDGAPFVCLVARDSAYLRRTRPGENFDYHAYRDVDIANFVAAAEMLVARGYYVIRMGSVVEKRIPSENSMVIDYATSDVRSDLLDIYLGAKCFFCLTVGSGIDAISMAFGRPMAYVNIVPICNYPTSRSSTLFLAKRHRLIAEDRWLSLTETFANGSAFCLTTDCYAGRGVELVDNSAREIMCVALEMLERLSGQWVPGPEDEALQKKFWELYPLDTREATEGHASHGRALARHSAHFLRENKEWLR